MRILAASVPRPLRLHDIHRWPWLRRAGRTAPAQGRDRPVTPFGEGRRCSTAAPSTRRSCVVEPFSWSTSRRAAASRRSTRSRTPATPIRGPRVHGPRRPLKPSPRSRSQPSALRASASRPMREPEAHRRRRPRPGEASAAGGAPAVMVPLRCESTVTRRTPSVRLLVALGPSFGRLSAPPHRRRRWRPSSRGASVHPQCETRARRRR
jgi:hypothetical protein